MIEPEPGLEQDGDDAVYFILTHTIDSHWEMESVLSRGVEGRDVPRVIGGGTATRAQHGTPSMTLKDSRKARCLSRAS